MRPRIIDFLNQTFGVSFFNYIVPDPAIIYAIMLGLGLWLFIRRCRIRGLNRYHASGLAIWVCVAGLIGARLFFLLQNLDSVVARPGIILEINGATVSWGVYLGGCLGALGYFLHSKQPAAAYLDTAASVIGIGPMIGRWACFLNGDDYGSPSSLPWAATFPHGSYPFVHHVRQGWLSPMASESLPVHPVQLYESLAGLGLLIAFTVLWRTAKFKPGVLFALFWIGYGVCRFVVEIFRGDAERGFVGPLSTGQFLALSIILISSTFLLWKHQWQLRIRDNSPVTP